MKLRLFFLLASVCGLLFASEAQALVISPLRYEITLDPGKEQVMSLTIKNDADEQRTYRASVSGAKQAPEGHPIFGEGYDVLESWIEPREITVDLAPREEKKLFFTVAAPANSAPGTHTAALIVAPASTNKPSSNITTQAAALVTVTVAGVVHEAASIETWKADAAITMHPKNTVDLSFKNNGTVSLPVRGSISIINMSGVVVREVPLELGNSLLPGASRTIQTHLQSLPLTIGPYKAVVNLHYGRSQVSTAATLTFWYIPLWALGAIGALLAISIGARLVKR